MSSEISIEVAQRAVTVYDEPPQPTPRDAGVRTQPDARADDGFRPWHFFVLASILLATVSVMLARQSSPESLIVVSLTIAAAGGAAAAFYRMLAPLTQPFARRAAQPVGERTRAALEREKMLVLRTIKEVEFDRAMGKMSAKDFDEMAGRLRMRAMSLMRQLDAESGAYAAAIEEELRTRLASSANPAGGTASGSTTHSSQACGCGASNDRDALFCKKCGRRLAA